MRNPRWLALWAGFSLSGAVADPGARAPVSIDGAWVRAMPPTQRMTAAYMSVTNRGDTALEITGASADVAETAEIHTSREVNGLMRMEQLDSVPLAPGQTVRLSPGGTHLMLLGMANMPAAGSTARLCLEFSNANSACVDAPVQSGGTVGPAQEHHGHH